MLRYINVPDAHLKPGTIPGGVVVSGSPDVAELDVIGSVIRVDASRKLHFEKLPVLMPRDLQNTVKVCQMLQPYLILSALNYKVSVSSDGLGTSYYPTSVKDLQ